MIIIGQKLPFFACHSWVATSFSPPQTLKSTSEIFAKVFLTFAKSETNEKEEIDIFSNLTYEAIEVR